MNINNILEWYWHPKFLKECKQSPNIITPNTKTLPNQISYFVPTIRNGVSASPIYNTTHFVEPMSFTTFDIGNFQCIPINILDTPQTSDDPHDHLIFNRLILLGTIDNQIVVIKKIKSDFALSYVLKTGCINLKDVEGPLFAGDVFQTDLNKTLVLTNQPNVSIEKIVIQPYLLRCREIDPAHYERSVDLKLIDNTETVLLGIGRYLWYLQSMVVDLDPKSTNLRSVGSPHRYTIIDTDYVRFLNPHHGTFNGEPPLMREKEILTSMGTVGWRIGLIFAPKLLRSHPFIKGVYIKYITAAVLFIDSDIFRTHNLTHATSGVCNYPSLYQNLLKNTTTSSAHLRLHLHQESDILNHIDVIINIIFPLNYPYFWSHFMDSADLENGNLTTIILSQWFLCNILNNLEIFVNKYYNKLDEHLNSEICYDIIKNASMLFKAPVLFEYCDYVDSRGIDSDYFNVFYSNLIDNTGRNTINQNWLLNESYEMGLKLINKMGDILGSTMKLTTKVYPMRGSWPKDMHINWPNDGYSMWTWFCASVAGHEFHHYTNPSDISVLSKPDSEKTWIPGKKVLVWQIPQISNQIIEEVVSWNAGLQDPGIPYKKLDSSFVNYLMAYSENGTNAIATIIREFQHKENGHLYTQMYQSYIEFMTKSFAT